MTTDLTGDFELGEDEFDWDVFLPDSDEAAVEDVATAFEDETDESDFDWDGALRDDSAPESGADDSARAGAAYDRIVDTVRRSFEDEPSTQADSEQPAASSPLVGTDEETESSGDEDREPAGSGFVAPFTDPGESEADTDPVVAWAPASAFGADAEPASIVELEPESTWRAEPARGPAAVFVQEPGFDAESHARPEADLEAGEEDDPELDHWLALDDVPPLAGTEPVRPSFVSPSSSSWRSPSPASSSSPRRRSSSTSRRRSTGIGRSIRPGATTRSRR